MTGATDDTYGREATHAIADARQSETGAAPRDLPGLLAARAIAEHNKLYWARKVDPLNFSDASNDIWRAKSAACFQIEMDIRAILPSPSPGVSAPARVGSERPYTTSEQDAILDADPITGPIRARQRRIMENK